MNRSRQVVAVTVMTVTVLAIAMPALAHIGTTPEEVAAGESSSIAFRVGHGCDDSPTISVAMEIPAGVSSVTPRAKPGWSVETEEGLLPEPVEVDGETISEGVVRVSWTGGSLDAHQYDEFVIRARMPDAVGETVYFPVVQSCEEGEHAWIQIPEQGGVEPESPAPGIVLVASTDGDGQSSATTALTWAALALGALGVALGGVALATTRRKG